MEKEEVNRLDSVFFNINHSVLDEDEKCPFFRMCPRLQTPEMKDQAWGFCLYQPNFQKECGCFRKLLNRIRKIRLTFSFEGKILYKGRLLKE